MADERRVAWFAICLYRIGLNRCDENSPVATVERLIVDRQRLAAGRGRLDRPFTATSIHRHTRCVWGLG